MRNIKLKTRKHNKKNSENLKTKTDIIKKGDQTLHIH